MGTEILLAAFFKESQGPMLKTSFVLVERFNVFACSLPASSCCYVC